MRWRQQVQRRSEISIAVISLVKVKGKRVFCREREKESERCTFHTQNTLYSVIISRMKPIMLEKTLDFAKI